MMGVDQKEHVVKLVQLRVKVAREKMENPHPIFFVHTFMKVFIFNEMTKISFIMCDIYVYVFLYMCVYLTIAINITAKPVIF